MKENIGRLFKVKPEKNKLDIYSGTYKLIDVDDEFCTIEWIQDESRISKMYIVDFEYFISSGAYYWI